MLPLPAPGAAAASTRLDEPVLHWVVRGRALIEVDGRSYEVGGAAALWVPAGAFVRITITRADVLLPVPHLTVPSAVPIALAVPQSWRPWLLSAFGEALGYLDGSASREQMQALLRESVLSATAPSHPQSPTSAELVKFVDALSRAPGVSLRTLARVVLPGWGTRTLQRRFLAETGLAPSEWARQHRVVRAAHLLAQGRQVSFVAHTLGYGTSSALSRAFRDGAGMPPGQWQRTYRAQGGIARLRDAPLPGAAPATRTWQRINGSHVAVWLAYGRATLIIGGGQLNLEAGHGVVLPAGVPNSIDLHSGAVLLPVGYRSGYVGGVGIPVAPAIIESAQEADLLQAIAAAYTSVRPIHMVGEDGFDSILGQSVTLPATAGDAELASLASALTMGAVAPMLGACARWLGCAERDLSRSINDRAGCTFTQWIRLVRMTRARIQLQGGDCASTVFRRVGYSHLPAFSRAFRQVHGRSPQALDVVPGTAREAERWRSEVARQSAYRLAHPAHGSVLPHLPAGPGAL